MKQKSNPITIWFLIWLCVACAIFGWIARSLIIPNYEKDQEWLNDRLQDCQYQLQIKPINFYDFQKAQKFAAISYPNINVLLYKIDDPVIYSLAQCESGGNPFAHNENDPNGGSYGLLQFQETTFQEFCVDKYGLTNNIWDYNTQIECAENMLREGLKNHWSCAKNI